MCKKNSVGHEKNSNNMKGENNPNFWKRIGIKGEFKPKYFKVMSPDGVIYEGHNLT